MTGACSRRLWVSAGQCVGLCVCAEFTDWFVCMGQRGIGHVPSVRQSPHKQSRYNGEDLCVRERKYRDIVDISVVTFSTQTQWPNNIIMLPHTITWVIHSTLYFCQKIILHITYTSMKQKDTQKWLKKKYQWSWNVWEKRGKMGGKGKLCKSGE